jgi:hypothetical protein
MTGTEDCEVEGAMTPGELKTREVCHRLEDGGSQVKARTPKRQMRISFEFFLICYSPCFLTSFFEARRRGAILSKVSLSISVISSLLPFISNPF